MPLSLRLMGIAVFSGWMVANFLIPLAALGQITPDTTLGAESSQVLPIGGSGFILGGATRGANLFHSFSEFNVAEGEFAVFTNPVGVERIFSRVTGGGTSDISGELGVLGDADLFFLNPNGILFGPKSSLAVAGSFVATTANGFVFEDNQLFNARNPAPAPLLAVNVPIGIQYGNQQPGVIRNQGFLAVNPGESLLLAGGDVVLENSSIGVFPGSGGQVQIAAIDDVGILDLTLNDGLIGLDIETDLKNSDLFIANSQINVLSNEKTSIAISARNIDVSSSLIFAGIGQGLGFPEAEAGDIRINADSLVLRNNTLISNSIFGEGSAGNLVIQIDGSVSLNGSGLFSTVEADAVGEGGDIQLTADSLRITNGSVINASTFGEGNAGNLILAVDGLVALDGTTPNEQFGSGLFSTVEAGAVGEGGDIELTAGSLRITDGSVINASTFGEGNAGNLILAVDGLVSLNGTTPSGQFSSTIGSIVAADAVGEGGDIQLTADSLRITDGSVINASTLGEGNAGNLILAVDGLVALDGTTPNGQFGSGLFSAVEADAVGEGGDIKLTAGSLRITNGAAINASTRGEGDAGNLILTVNGLVALDGTTPNGQFGSGLASRVEAGAVGEGGDIQLTADSLRITDGSVINASTLGEGNAGNLILAVDGLVALDGTTPNGQFGSGLFSAVEADAVGEGGDIKLTAGSLRITSGAAINASTRGEGDAGNLILAVDGLVALDGTTPSEQFSSTIGSIVEAGAVGEGGDIKLTAGSLRITSGAAINASTLGEGDAGNLILTVNGLVALDGTTPSGQFSSGLASRVEAGAVGEGGNIELTADSLRITNDAVINASTLGEGNAGNLILNVDDSVSSDGSALSSIVVVGAVGEGGDIKIRAESLRLNSAGILTVSLGQGNPGNIDLQIRESINLEQGFISSSSSSLLSERGGDIAIAAGSLNLENGSQISSETLNSQGGNIVINLDGLLIMRDGSLISTTAGTAQAGGDGGNIDIAADFVIGVREENSDIAADAFEGNGGQVTISALDIFGLEFREERTSFSDITASSEQGASGITTFNRLTPVDVRQGLTELPENVVDPTGLIDRSCNTSAVQNSEFVITGRGGLPPEPDERSDNSQFFDDLGPIVAPSNSAEAMAEPLPSKNDSPDSIQEAQGWIVNDMGQIQLIAAVPNEASVRTATSPCN